MEERIYKPCLGVIPHYHNLALDEEDSLGLQEIATTPWPSSVEADRPLRIAVIALPSLSNFTDFDSLLAEPSVDLRLVRTKEALFNADVVILPGSKQTAADLRWLREQGLAQAIEIHASSSLVVGICGGMQMLGRSIADPDRIESTETVTGLMLLPITTTMQAEKTTILNRGTLLATTLFKQRCENTKVTGYEIHIGTTTYEDGGKAFAQLSTGQEGAIDASTRIFGTYLHGLFDDDTFRHLFITNARVFHKLTPALARNDWKQQREEALNAFAAHVEASLDMPAIFSWAGLTYTPKIGPEA
jgi:adenosylcobyric acid synthase